MIELLQAGLLTTVQDAGRYGHAALGIGQAGPMDRIAARLANWLVGNDGAAPLLEISLAGPRLHFRRDACIALAGAQVEANIDGAVISGWRPWPIARGSVLDCRVLRRGARAYLAVAGGLTVEPVLGSCSTDVNAGLGPLGGGALAAGATLALGRSGLQLRKPPRWSLSPLPWFDGSGTRRLRLLPGSHYPELDAASRSHLLQQRFRVASESNRVGVRLHGPSLQLSRPLELVSAAVGAGTLQLPPGGQPIVLTAEHPTTGGYPRIAHLIDVDQPHLAQRRPGDAVEFALVDADEAEHLRQRRERALARVHETLQQRLREIRCDA